MNGKLKDWGLRLQLSQEAKAKISIIILKSLEVRREYYLLASIAGVIGDRFLKLCSSYFSVNFS